MRLTGSAGKEFLHGQTTADFSSCVDGDVRYAAFCNPKGRVLADVLAVIVDNEEVLLRGRQVVMSALSEHLKPYLAFARCTLATTDWITVCRAEALADLRAVPDYAGDTLVGVTVPLDPSHAEYWGAQAPSASGSAMPLDTREVEILNKRARIEGETMGSYLPQDLDYDCNDTVSFTKGCYTGQEIVARLHYRGVPKRRLHRAQVAAPVTAGEALTDAEGKSVGSVVNHHFREQVSELLIELVPEAAAGSVVLKGRQSPLSQIARCHADKDQSTG
jgi:folate-binding protein YgfZ